MQHRVHRPTSPGTGWPLGVAEDLEDLAGQGSKMKKKNLLKEQVAQPRRHLLGHLRALEGRVHWALMRGQRRAFPGAVLRPPKH